MANPEQLATNSFALDPAGNGDAPGRSNPLIQPPTQIPQIPSPSRSAPAQRPEASHVPAQEEATALDARPEDMWGGNATLDENHDDEDEATNIVSAKSMDTSDLDITDAGAVPGPEEIGAAVEELEKMTELASRENLRSKPDRKSKYMPSLASQGPDQDGQAGHPGHGHGQAQAQAHAQGQGQGQGQAQGRRPGRQPGSDRPGDPLMGAVLDGRYQIVERVGRGGMGTVYRGRHVTINKDVAIKVLAPQLAEWPAYVERFLQEARAASMLRHPNVVTITDFGYAETDNLPYFVMEYLEGEDLRDRLQRTGRMSWGQARPIVLQICSALDSAHRKGVIHRDIKPENCFLLSQDDDIELVKLLDFGIAKVASDTEPGSLTSHGVVLGTVEYISPERANKQPVDTRADIYSLGVLIYRMLTGRTPFYGEAVEVVTAHVYEPPPPLHKVAPDAGISPDLEAIVLRTLSKRPEDRQQTVAELAVALQAVPIPGMDVVNLPGFQRAPTMPPFLAGGTLSGISSYNAPNAPAQGGMQQAPYSGHQGGHQGGHHGSHHGGHHQGGHHGYQMQRGYGAQRMPSARTKLAVGIIFFLLLLLVIVWSAIESSEEPDEPSGWLMPATQDCPTDHQTGWPVSDAASACADAS